jgi:hypothetical protein
MDADVSLEPPIIDVPQLNWEAHLHNHTAVDHLRKGTVAPKWRRRSGSGFASRRYQLTVASQISKLGAVRLMRPRLSTSRLLLWRGRDTAKLKRRCLLLLGQIRRKLFPERPDMMMLAAVRAPSSPRRPRPRDGPRRISRSSDRAVHADYPLDTAALAEPGSVFGMSPNWTSVIDGMSGHPRHCVDRILVDIRPPR